MVEKKAIKRKKDPGASPGTLIHVGERKTDRVNVRVIDCDEQSFCSCPSGGHVAMALFKEKATVTWINVGGLHETALIGKIGLVTCSLFRRLRVLSST